MTMKRIIIVLSVFLIISCSSVSINNRGSKEINLDYTNCLVESKTYTNLRILIPDHFKSSSLNSHGYCENRFLYSDSSILYLSTNIYSGSDINWTNLESIGIDTYAKGRSLEPIDTIINQGVSRNGKFWKEYILGDYVVGYSNASFVKKKEFDDSILTIRKEY